uniref:hypothetical protein n=1 Tax=Methylobacterium nigriterrae TaxID=3127512 RepID=UPI00301343F6
EFTARESHKPQPPQCDADPDTAPRLFNLEIDMQTGKAKWDRLDAEDDSGNMRPVPQSYISPIRFEFDSGKSDVDLKKMSYTDSFEKWLSENRKHKFDVKAFTGGEDVALVRARAVAVDKLLATRGVPKSRRRILVVTDQYRSGVAVTGR